MDPRFLFVAFVQNKGFVVADFALGTVFCVNYGLERFVSAVEVVDLRDELGQVLFFMGDKKGNLIVVRWEQQKDFDSCFYLEIHAGLISDIKCNSQFKKNKGLVFATGSFDRSIRVQMLPKDKKLSRNNLKLLKVLKHRFRIASLDWDPFVPHRLLNVCQKHTTIQVWTLQPKKDLQEAEKEGRKLELGEEDEQHYLANIRGHKGFITCAMWSRFDKDCILTCSDDQSVKIWNLVNIKYRKPPSKKKKDTQLGEIIVEEEEDESEEEGDRGGV